MRHLAVAGLAAGSPCDRYGQRLRPERRRPAQDQAKPAANSAQPNDAAKDNQRKTDEFVEAAQAINGPAGNPECVWLGRRVVRLMWLDDLDTAFRHLDLYDRFGCPGGHVQATFRCLTRFGGQIDPKVAETPERPRSRLLDQSGRAAADAPLPRLRRRRPPRGSAAPAPAAYGRRPLRLRRHPPNRRSSRLSGNAESGQIRKFYRGC